MLIVASLVALACVSPGLAARAAPADPAARGLDVFIHAPREAAPGATLPLDLLSYGFPTVTRAEPLAKAEIEVGWDPESLDEARVAPPTLKAQTDGDGRAALTIPVPRGSPRELTLLVAVRYGGHARTQSITVKRVAPSSVEVYTTDTRVVPGSTISAWVRATETQHHAPLAGEKVVVELSEGGVARHTQEVTTDSGGMAMVRVPIPRIDEPRWSWNLEARIPKLGGGFTHTMLTPREETPGSPTVHAELVPKTAEVRAGDSVPFVLRLRDATGQVIPNHEVRYWLGQKGLVLPKPNDVKAEAEWLAISTLAVTDGAGEIHGEAHAPTLVKAQGTTVFLVMRTEIEGHVLASSAEVSVGARASSATVTPEARAIVPGIAQSLFLHVESGRGEGVRGDFVVTGDGLAAKATTNERGDAEITWDAPLGVGAFRDVGACASGVAAAVTVRPARPIEALSDRTEPWKLCVPVDRDAEALVRVSPPLARPGETVRIDVARARRGDLAKKPALSLLLGASDAAQAVSAWIPAGAVSTTVTLPGDAADGSWTLSAATPEAARAARTVGAHLFVAAKVLPRLSVVRTGGRAAPLGSVSVSATLTDGHGAPLKGSIATVVTDAFGGGHVSIDTLDTRARLCGELGGYARCDALLEGGREEDANRRALVANVEPLLQGPQNDPGAHASKDLERAFGEVLRSLEGAVFESTASPEKLTDARRREGGRWTWNPELFTLVTDAIPEPPKTPGGELLALADLVAVDPQVTFDNVARRITRLKLFRVLSVVRAYRRQKQLDPDEPALRDPNALLRRVVREGGIDASLLTDPWGGTIQFARASGPPVPFLNVAHGYELRAPGPDGQLGTADDVRDPFERVVRSGSPYANAVQEDRIVDAKWDMEVSDTTVEGWQRMFEELTGTELGNGHDGNFLSGRGEGGGGSGDGIGLGSVGTVGHGRGRSTTGIATGDAYFSEPVRTDDQGRASLTIPLGSVETTWRVAFIGIPDGGEPAATTLDIPAEVPLSAQADAGATWVSGDAADVRVRVRNRTDKAVTATVEMSPEGAIAGALATKSVFVPARGVTETSLRVTAKAAGTATLVVRTRAVGLPADALVHAWEVVPPGEKRVLSQVAWVSGTRDLGIALDLGYALRDAPELVLTRGYTEPVAWALDSLEPERQNSLPALLDALETALRVKAWAQTRKGPRARALVGIADSFARRAEGRYRLLAQGETRSFTESTRFARLTFAPRDPTSTASCPPTFVTGLSAESELEPLRVLPDPTSEPPPCWGMFVNAASSALTSASASTIAEIVLALAEHPEHAALYASAVTRLRFAVSLTADGAFRSASDRAERATILAALLRSVKISGSPATADTLFARLARLRDANGGYGSSAATLAVTESLLASQLDGHGVTRAHVAVPASTGVPAFAADVIVPEDGSARVPLPARALDVVVTTEGAGLVADFERPALRLWTRPPPPMTSPVSLEVVWPSDARAGHVSIVRVMLRHALPESAMVDVRLPLPPGATLAEALGKQGAPSGISEIQGVLAMRWTVDHDVAVIDVPVRFALSGNFTVPEGNARVAKEAFAMSVSPARALVVR